VSRVPPPQGKHTAEVVALARAAGSRDPAIANPDYLAERLLRPLHRLLLCPGLNRLARASFERRVPGMFLYHQARTKHLDTLLLGALEGVRQLVILGAVLPGRSPAGACSKWTTRAPRPGSARACTGWDNPPRT
jgi:O-methyltransferase involved in polyketide biosynthesis